MYSSGLHHCSPLNGIITRLRVFDVEQEDPVGMLNQIEPPAGRKNLGSSIRSVIDNISTLMRVWWTHFSLHSSENFTRSFDVNITCSSSAPYLNNDAANHSNNRSRCSKPSLTWTSHDTASVTNVEWSTRSYPVEQNPQQFVPSPGHHLALRPPLQINYKYYSI